MDIKPIRTSKITIPSRTASTSVSYCKDNDTDNLEEKITSKPPPLQVQANSLMHIISKHTLNVFKLGRRKQLILLHSTLNRLLLTYSIAIFNPIFPNEAIQKGLGEFEISIAFGVLYAVVFFTSPIFGKYLVSIGPNLIFIVSLYVAGIANLLFVYLHDRVEKKTQYFTFVVMVRMLMGLAYSGSGTVTQAVVSYEFQENLASANGILQSGIILGYVLGPSVSGFLYEFGGYSLPFLVIASLDLAYGIFVQVTLPSVGSGESSNQEEAEEKMKISLWKFLHSPLFVISVLCIIAGPMGMGNIDATLTLHLVPFGMSIGKIGLLFALVDFVNAFSNSICAYIIDSFHTEKTAIITGMAGMAAGFLILGRLSFQDQIVIPPSLVTISIALIVIGVGYGMALISLFQCMVISTVECGYNENDLDVMGYLSGLFNSAVMFGAFLGQFSIGVIVSHYSDLVGYTVVGFITAVCWVLASLVFVVRFMRRRGN